MIQNLKRVIVKSDKNSNNPDFQVQSKKKPRLIEKSTNKLSRKERIERVKKFSQKHNQMKKPDTPLSISDSNKNNGHNSRGVDLVNYDSIFTDKSLFCVEDALKFPSESTDPAPDHPSSSVLLQSLEMEQLLQTETVSSPVVDLLLNLKEKVCDLNKNVTLLRKQVSRVELKTSGWPAGWNGPSQNICSDDLLDFESLLEKENLPCKTCVEINELEAKLRADTKYRSKLVSNAIDCFVFI